MFFGKRKEFAMALIMIIGLVVILAVLAALYGHDSRESLHSKEQELASYGMDWSNRLAQEEALADELAQALRNQSRPRATQTVPAREQSVPSRVA
jgi:hypothetical protein